MTTRTRKSRGNRTQLVVAGWYQRLWPTATTQGSSAAGRDVQNVPLSIEVKARTGFDPLAYIRQARKAARPEEDVLPPHVVMRPNGVGEEHLGDWLVIRRLEDDTAILAELLELRDLIRRLHSGAVDAGTIAASVGMVPQSVVEARKSYMGLGSRIPDSGTGTLGVSGGNYMLRSPGVMTSGNSRSSGSSPTGGGGGGKG